MKNAVMAAMMMAVANAQPTARQSIEIVRTISSFGFSVALSPEGTDVFIGNVDSTTMPGGPDYTVFFERIAVDVTQNSQTTVGVTNTVSGSKFAYSLTASNETENGHRLRGQSRRGQ